MNEMKKFLGVKLVKAVEMTREAFNATPYDAPDDPGEQPSETAGYQVIYPDGYKSWCPAAQFEAANFELVEGDKISLEDVQRFKGEAKATNLDEKTTLVSALCLSGFVQHEVSSCVDPKNYDAVIGAEIANKRINESLFKCLGFVLQWARFGLGEAGRDASAPVPSNEPALLDYQQRVVDDHAELGVKLNTLEQFMKSSVFEVIDAAQRELYIQRRALMEDYYQVLGDLLSNFSDPK